MPLRPSTRALLARSLAGALVLVACRDPAGPDVSRSGDLCPVTPSSIAGFFGCVEITGQLLDAEGRPVGSPEIRMLRAGRDQFQDRQVLHTDSSGRFRVRFLAGPLPDLPDATVRVTLPVKVFYTRASPMHLSYHEPYDSLALNATFVRSSERPYRYEVSLRQSAR